MTHEFLTPMEAAKILKVSRRTIYQWIGLGKIPSLKVGGTTRGGTIRIPRGEFFAWIEDQKREQLRA